MHSKIFLKGDSDPLYVNDPPDVVLETLGSFPEAIGTDFVRIEMAPYTRDEPTRPAYIVPSRVAAVLPVHPREWEWLQDHPPEWLE